MNSRRSESGGMADSSSTGMTALRSITRPAWMTMPDNTARWKETSFRSSQRPGDEGQNKDAQADSQASVDQVVQRADEHSVQLLDDDGAESRLTGTSHNRRQI